VTPLYMIGELIASSNNPSPQKISKRGGANFSRALFTKSKGFGGWQSADKVPRRRRLGGRERTP